jgi:hypothetical protein
MTVFLIIHKTKKAKMKKVMMFGILIAGLYLASCNTNDVTPADNSAIVSVDGSGGGGGGKDSIAISALPAVITSYIKTTYPTATIHRAAKRTDGTYTVIIDIAGVHKGLKFDANGVFVSELIKSSGGQKGGKDSTHVKDSTHAPKDSTHAGGGKKHKGGKG